MLRKGLVARTALAGDATFNKGMQSVLGGGTRTFKYPAILLLPNSPLPVLPFGQIKFQTKRNPLITVM